VADKGVWWIPKPPLKGLVGPFYSFGGDSLVFMGLAVLLLGLIASLLVGMLTDKKWPWISVDGSEGVSASAILLLFVMMLSPILISFVMSHVTTPIYVSRFMMGGYGSFLVLMALGISLLPMRPMQWAGAVVLVGLSAARIPATNYGHSFKANSPWRELTQSLKAQPPQRVLYRPDDEWPVDWYLRRQSPVPLAKISANPEDKVDTVGAVTLICRRGKCPNQLVGTAGLSADRTQVTEFGDLAVATYQPSAPPAEPPALPPSPAN
jgi:hypothetical protein